MWLAEWLRRGHHILRNRPKTDFGVVVRIAIGDRNIDAVTSQLIETVADQLLANPLALMVRRNGDGRQHEDGSIIACKCQPGEDDAADRDVVLPAGEHEHIVCRCAGQKLLRKTGNRVARLFPLRSSERSAKDLNEFLFATCGPLTDYQRCAALERGVKSTP